MEKKIVIPMKQKFFENNPYPLIGISMVLVILGINLKENDDQKSNILIKK